MTDRHSGYVVVLAADVREDDAEEGVLNAIRMIRGVAGVEPVLADFGPQAIASMRRDREWSDALFKLIKNPPGYEPKGEQS
jgi:hypothetical protein